MNEETRTKVLVIIAEAVKGCPSFFEWDDCNVNCPVKLCDFCSRVFATHNAAKASKK